MGYSWGTPAAEFGQAPRATTIAAEDVSASLDRSMTIHALLQPEHLPFVINWEAWATFTVGVAAVIGATIVGLRQTGIARQQTLILASQVEIERARLRAELYDRRLTVYEGVERYIKFITSKEGAELATVPRSFPTYLVRASFCSARRSPNTSSVCMCRRSGSVTPSIRIH